MENRSYPYKKISHFSDMLLQMNNEPDKMIPYTNEKFEEDVKKFVRETKYNTPKQIGVNTIANSVGSDENIIKTPPQPKIMISPWTKNKN